MAWTGSKAISSSQAPYLSLPPGGESSLIPLLVVSPSNPLRWALMGSPELDNEKQATQTGGLFEESLRFNYFRLKKADMPGY